MKQFNFDPILVHQLSIGKIIVEHTRNRKHLPLLKALLKEAFPGGNRILYGTSPFYLLSKFEGEWIGCFSLKGEEKALPIHDFLIKEETTQFNFDPILVNKLSIGEIEVEHTQKTRDLPLLQALLKEAFPEDNEIPCGTFQVYLLFKFEGDKWVSWISLKDKDKALPLHDFLIKKQ